MLRRFTRSVSIRSAWQSSILRFLEEWGVWRARKVPRLLHLLSGSGLYPPHQGMLAYQLGSDGSTLVLITHDPNIAGEFPRRLHMRDGEIVEDERG